MNAQPQAKNFGVLLGETREYLGLSTLELMIAAHLPLTGNKDQAKQAADKAYKLFTGLEQRECPVTRHYCEGLLAQVPLAEELETYCVTGQGAACDGPS